MVSVLGGLAAKETRLSLAQVIIIISIHEFLSVGPWENGSCG